MFTIAASQIDPLALAVEVKDPVAGGFVSFEGWVRNHNEGHEVKELAYEVYHSLAIKEAEKIMKEAFHHFDIVKIRCVHREGLLQIGDLAVWVGVSAVHRGDAFKACEYLINQIKGRLPIWKKEFYLTGDSGWVNCEHCETYHPPLKVT